jgi:hypothetical protein
MVPYVTTLRTFRCSYKKFIYLQHWHERRYIYCNAELNYTCGISNGNVFFFIRSKYPRKISYICVLLFTEQHYRSTQWTEHSMTSDCLQSNVCNTKIQQYEARTLQQKTVAKFAG